MQIDFLPLLSFVLITTFTPGPNNVSSAAMGVLHGYRKTLDYLLGIVLGFFFVILATAWSAGRLLETFPVLGGVLRYAGMAYILYLAYHTFRASYGFDESDGEPLGFRNGMALQVLNPKLIVYGLTLFSTFLAPITGNLGALLLAAFLLTLTAFAAISVWALFGAAIKNYLHEPRIKLGVNTLLALFLVYSALELGGLL